MQQADRGNESRAVGRAMGISSSSHAFFAVTMIGLGIVGLIHGDFIQTWSGVPKSFAAREALAYVCAVVSLASGVGLLWKRAALLASRVLLAFFLLWLLVFRAPYVVRDPSSVFTWWACGDTAVMAAGAWVLYVWLAGERLALHPRLATGENGSRLARMLYGLALIPFGIAHFTNVQDTAPLVPSWLPWHVALAYLTGAAFLAAGVAVVVGVCARLAANLSALQMGLFTLLVWVPVVVGGANASQWSEFVDSWALTAGAWIVAESYRGMPWLAVGKR